jgi:hypothetical protein
METNSGSLYGAHLKSRWKWHYYSIGNKQWVARGTISIHWKKEIRRCKMNIRRGVQGQRRTGLLFLVEAVVDCVE